jgi:hypothetical protein
MQQRTVHRIQQQRPQQPKPTPQTGNSSRSGLWNFLALLTLIAALACAWPSILKAIEKGAYEGAKAGAKEASKVTAEDVIKELKAQIEAENEAANGTLTWSQ